MNFSRSSDASTADQGSLRSWLTGRLSTLAEVVAFAAIGVVLWQCFTFRCFNLNEIIVLTLAILSSVVVGAAVLGWAVHRRFRGDAPRKAPLGVTVFSSVFLLGAVLAIVGLIVKTVAEMPPIFGPCVYRDLTYWEFRRAVGPGFRSYFDPKGASHIDLKSQVQRNNNYHFTRTSIGRPSYEALLARCSKKFERLGGFAPVCKTTSATPAIPEDWQQPWRTPDWWRPHEAGPKAECTRWEHQYHPTHASGQYWLYDPESSTLWTWEWTCGHNF